MSHAPHATILAELRSLMQLPSLDASQREKLWQLIEASSHDAARHEQIIAPYLSGFKSHFVTPLRHLWSLDDLRTAARIAPFASFQCTFSFSRGAMVRLLESDLPPFIAQLKARCFEPGDIVHLARSKRLDRLTHLDLSSNMFDQEGLEAICQAPFLHRLSSLKLHANNLGHDGATRLAALGERRLAMLEQLDLSHNAIHSPGLAALAGSGLFDELAELDLRRNAIDALGASALVQEANLSRLKSLRLSSNPIGDDGLEALVNDAPLASDLHHLELGHTRLGMSGIEALTSSPHLEDLFSLDLSNNHLEDEAIVHLARSPRLATLCSLGLSNNRLTDRGAQALSESPHLRGLQHLSIGSNFITAEGIRLLNESPNLKNLSPLTGTVPRR